MIKAMALTLSITALLISSTTFALKAVSGYSLYNASSNVYTTINPNGCVGIQFPATLDANMPATESTIITITQEITSQSFPCKTTYIDTAGDFCTITLTDVNNNVVMDVDNSNGRCSTTGSRTGVYFYN